MRSLLLIGDPSSGNDRLVLSDFGFATAYRLRDGRTRQSTTQCGTRPYLAPEGAGWRTLGQHLKRNRANDTIRCSAEALCTRRCRCMVVGNCARHHVMWYACCRAAHSRIMAFHAHAGQLPWAQSLNKCAFFTAYATAWHAINESQTAIEDIDDDMLYSILPNQLPWRSPRNSALVIGRDATNLLLSMLTLEPHKRIRAKETLAHRWLTDVDGDAATVEVDQALASVSDDNDVEAEKSPPSCKKRRLNAQPLVTISNTQPCRGFAPIGELDNTVKALPALDDGACGCVLV